MPDSKILVVIATYNEMENLPGLVERILGLLPSATVLVIDDNSPDGTGQWCLDSSRDLPRLKCRIRSGKLGLGSATLEGLEYGIDHEFDLIATMDGDFSHQPEDLVQLLQEMDSRPADVLIGSRYVDRGRVIGWPFYRRIASRMVNSLARIWLGLNSRDNSGAFRIYRREILESIDLATIRSRGYGYLEEILYRLQSNGATIAEYPITFHNRARGRSKTDLRVGLGKIWRILWARFGR